MLFCGLRERRARPARACSVRLSCGLCPAPVRKLTPVTVDPTQPDANIINKDEIIQNVVNECGRTLLAGNMDVGENTEIALSNKTVTQVSKGSTVDVDIAQGNDDGKGPYTCDMDLQSNAAGATGQVPLKVQESNAKNGIISLKVQLPDDFDCIGGK